jgi:D-3-phosphoglycerate dehydrogenase
MPTKFTAIVTSDRYGSSDTGLDPERELARQFPDIELDLRGEPIHTEEDMIALGAETDAFLISTREAVTRNLVENLPRVKVIARYGVGLDNVDLDAAADNGIVITHFPQYCTSDVANHALSLLLAINRRIVEQNEDLHQGAWNNHGRMTGKLMRGPVPSMSTLTIGVIGMGRIGSAVVSRLTPFGSRIVVSDPYIDDERIRAAGAIPVSFDELIATADLITIHCPLTPETRGLFGPDQFARMKPDASIVNTARGPIIQQAAVIDHLTANPGARAGLDVFEIEPLPEGNPLYDLPNAILTPHSAYYSEQSVEIVRRQTFLSALAVLRGYLPPTVANPAVLERVSLQPSPA